MATYWGNFITSGNPNSPLPTELNWPVYSALADPLMVFETPASQVLSGVLNSTCNFFDELGYKT
jgi:hypothetical protein